MKYRVLILPLLISFLFIPASVTIDNNITDKLKDLVIEQIGIDSPESAQIQEFLMTYDVKEGRIPSERLHDVYASLANMQAYHLKTSQKGGWENAVSDHGGRTRALVLDPSDPTGKKVWAGSVTGGLWYNNDAANPDSSWNVVSDFWQGLSVSSIVFDPNDSDIMYVGTGESQTALVTYRESSGKGLGIWKSIDGGQTFSLLPSTTDFVYISSMLCRNEGGNSVLYAGVLSGVYQGSQSQSLPSDGLYRSTDDGTTWQQVLPNISGTNMPFAVADIKENINGKLFVGTTFNLNGNGGACILTSYTGQSGSWSLNDHYHDLIKNTPGTYNLPGRIVLGCAPSDSNVVYALVGAGYQNSQSHPYYHVPYILRSYDGGVNWVQKAIPNNQPNWASLAWHALVVAVDPNDPNTVLVGGLDIHKSTDGGNNWNQISDWSLMYQGGGSQYAHGDQHVINFVNGSSSKAFFTSDGGIYYSNNVNTQFPVFQERNNGYTSLQFYTCAIRQDTNGINFLGGLQDNGTHHYDGSENLSLNTMVSGGDGAYCFYDDNDTDLIATSVYYNRYYIFDDGNYLYYVNGSNGMFINPADYYSETSTIIANACSFWGNNNDMLYIVENIQFYNDYVVAAGTGTQDPFSTLKVSPLSTGPNATVFAGTSQGDLFKLTNVPSSPSAVNIGSANFPDAWISSINVGKSEDTLLVTFSNYGVQSVWITTDGGTTWMDCEGNLPDIPVRNAIIHPQNSRQVMLATEVGIWTTDDILATGGAIWNVDNTFPNVRVDMLDIRTADNMVLAASHGRGLFYGKWDHVNPGVENHNVDKTEVSIYPNPASEIVNFSSESSKIDMVSFYDVNGKLCISEEVNASSFRIETGKLEKGSYFIKIVSNGKVQIEKLIIR